MSNCTAGAFGTLLPVAGKVGARKDIARKPGLATDAAIIKRAEKYR